MKNMMAEAREKTGKKNTVNIRKRKQNWRNENKVFCCGIVDPVFGLSEK